MSNVKTSTQKESFLGRGFSFPPRFTAGGADVEMVSNADDIEQSIRMLLGTTRGERVMRDSVGSDLTGLLFEDVDQLLLGRIEQTVSEAILKYESRVDLERVDVNVTDRLGGRIDVSVMYRIRATNSRFNLVFPFYLMEANRPG
jgi:phage baseplate assembly protein W